MPVCCSPYTEPKRFVINYKRIAKLKWLVKIYVKNECISCADKCAPWDINITRSPNILKETAVYLSLVDHSGKLTRHSGGMHYGKL